MCPGQGLLAGIHQTRPAKMCDVHNVSACDVHMFKTSVSPLLPASQLTTLLATSSFSGASTTLNTVYDVSIVPDLLLNMFNFAKVGQFDP